MKPIVSDSPDDQISCSRPLSTSRRRFLAMTLGVGLEIPLVGTIPVRQARRSCVPEVYHPFSPARTVILPSLDAHGGGTA